MPSPAARSAGIALCLALAGCGMRAGAPDTSNMPEAFGKLESHFLGCTDVVGFYAWPPIMGGTYVPRKSRGNEYFLGVPTYKQAQIWIRGPYKTGPQMTVLSRRANANPIDQNTTPRGWSFHEYPNSQFSCKGGWAVFPEETNDDRTNLRTLLRLASCSAPKSADSKTVDLRSGKR